MRFSSFVQKAILFLSFCSFTFAELNLNSSSSPESDALSLLAFKSKADSGNRLSYSVHSSSTVCKWQGVQCQINGKVVRLVLESLSLAGVFADNTLTRLDQLRVLSLQNNSLTGPIPDLAGLVNLKALFLDRNYFSGIIPPSISSLHRLRTLDLSYNELSGGIPVELSNLDRLNYLRLDSNRFNGSIPPLNQSSLEIFNVSVNFLTGPVPVTPTLSRFSPASFSINPQLCGVIVRTECRSTGPFFSKNTTKNPSSSPAPGVVKGQSAELESFTNSSSRNHKRLGLMVGLSAGLLVIVAATFCIIMAMKTSEKTKRRKGITATREIMETAEAADAAAEMMRMAEANELEEKVKRLQQGMAMKKSGNLVFFSGESPAYTAEQLMKAPAELLGTGTVGTTYKAVLDNRVIVCVKRLDAVRLAGTTMADFEKHMAVVGRLKHPNLVAIGAYFPAKEVKLLVYDYHPNGSLFSLIHGSKSTRAKPLHWTSCLKIAEDVAQGLSYIHESLNLPHGNLKSSNVLLGSDFEACLSDYCLSGLFENSPEPAMSDVYSFGVLLLELLTGKPAPGHPDLLPDDVVKWVKVSRDSNGGDMKENRVEMMIEVAIACRVRSPEMRPTMCEILKMLQEIKEADVMEDCGPESDRSIGS